MPFSRAFLCLLTLLVAPAVLAASETGPRERIRFTDDWRFHRGDAPDAGAALGYKAMRPWVLATGADLINAGVARPERAPGNPGADVSFVQPGFDDSSWQALRLPHDWAIYGPFSQDLPGETGKLPWQGVGWYRKRFQLPAEDAGKRIALDIDGAMAYSSVWINGHYVGGWPYGYTSYRLDLTPHLNPGAENVLAIRLENPPESSRWYPGSGLYRHVWLVKTPEIRVRQWGVFVSTPRVSAEEALVAVEVAVENLTSTKSRFTVLTRIHTLDTRDQLSAEPVAASEAFTVEIDPAREREAIRSLPVTVRSPLRWDLATPHRYAAVTTLERDGVVLDREVTPFGIRSIRYADDGGFLLNERRVQFQGVCLHHDLGALGAAINVRALERQLQILQSMGCNAVRTSHNPPAPELLELCDKMGLLVMAEAFDAWRRSKKDADLDAADPYDRAHDYSRVFDEWHERDLRALIRRDRNHPSVVLWSIGNEVLEQWFTDGWKLASRLAGIVREEDRTRPLTGGFNSPHAGITGFQTAVDAIGYNYKPWAYAPTRRANPITPVYSAESASTLSSRGEYVFPVEPDQKLKGRENFHVSSYDFSAAEWSSSPDFEWKGLDEAPYTSGEFVWTGFDYLGEPTPYNSDATNLLNFSDPAQRERVAGELAELGRIRVPSRSSYFGIIDLAGFPKDRYYLYQSRWLPETPMAHLVPHWNWPERVGQVTPVQVYTSGDEAELFLNGRSLGKKKKGVHEYRLYWGDVVYEPGELRAVVTKNGQPWAEAVTRTTGEARQLQLQPDRADLRADGDDLSFVTVRIADDAGQVVPRTHHSVTYRLDGPGDIVAVDNGDPTSHESFQATTRRAFNGLALVVVRTRRGETGPLTLHATADGLAPAAVQLNAGP